MRKMADPTDRLYGDYAYSKTKDPFIKNMYVIYRPDLFDTGEFRFATNSTGQAINWLQGKRVMCCDYRGARLFMGFDNDRGKFTSSEGVFTFEDPQKYCFHEKNVMKCDEGDVKSIEWRLKILEKLKGITDFSGRPPVLEKQKDLFLSTTNLLDRYKIATCSTKGKCTEMIEKVLLSNERGETSATIKHEKHLDPLREMKYLLGITERYVLYRPDLEVDQEGKVNLYGVYDYFDNEKQLKKKLKALKLTTIVCLENGTDPSGVKSTASSSTPRPQRIVVAVAKQSKTGMPKSKKCLSLSGNVMEKIFELYEMRFKVIRNLSEVTGTCRRVNDYELEGNTILERPEGRPGIVTRIKYDCDEPVMLNLYKTLWASDEFSDRYGLISLEQGRQPHQGTHEKTDSKANSAVYKFSKNEWFRGESSLDFGKVKNEYERIISKAEDWLERNPTKQ